jgi:excisionase family DNA binding protein
MAEQKTQRKRLPRAKQLGERLHSEQGPTLSLPETIEEKARKKQPRKRLHSPKCVTLSPREAAEIAGLGITRTYRLLRQGIMPSIPDPDGRGFRIPKSALLRWLDGCGGRPAEPASTNIQSERA